MRHSATLSVMTNLSMTVDQRQGTGKWRSRLRPARTANPRGAARAASYIRRAKPETTFSATEASPKHPSLVTGARSLIRGWIGDTSFFETLSAQCTRVAGSTGAPVVVCAITGNGQRVINAQSHAFLNDLSLRQGNKRCMYTITRSFYTGFCGEVRQVFECVYKFRPAVRITGIIDGVDPQKDITGAKYLSPPKRQ